LAIWQLPVILVLAGVWVVWGGYLMRRAVRDHVGRREAELNRCVVIALLAGLGGAISGAIAIALAWQVAQALTVQTVWLALPAAGMVFCLVSFLTVFASFQLPGGSLGKVWLKSFGPPLLVAAVAAVPTIWVACLNHEDKLANNRSIIGLQLIYKEIGARYAPARPPASIEDLTKQNVVLPRAYRHPSRPIGFFYMPSPMLRITEPTSRLLACDWADNQAGSVRAVLYVNGAVGMADPGKFQDLLAREENKAFATALKEAEKKLPPDD
jgi:hypothetical protein